MNGLPKPAHLEIRIDEWQVAQEKVDSVGVAVTWRGATDTPALARLLAEFPPVTDFVPIQLADGRTELAPAAWKHIRFGKGRPIFEAARSNFEAWAGGPEERVAQGRKRLTNVIRPLVPNFDRYTEKEQVDFLIRTQEKIRAVKDSVEALVAHLEFAAPDKGKSFPPLKNPRRNVQAAVFCDVMGSSRSAGELLGVPLPPSDQFRHENQTVRRMAEPGRGLLHSYFGETEWKNKVRRMREYRRWWQWYESLDNREGMYALLAKARNTSLDHEKRAAQVDGFDKTLDEWIVLVEARLEIEAIQDQNKYNEDFAWPGAIENERRRIQDEQFRVQMHDERFAEMFAAFDEPPSI